MLAAEPVLLLQELPAVSMTCRRAHFTSWLLVLRTLVLVIPVDNDRVRVVPGSYLYMRVHIHIPTHIYVDAYTDTYVYVRLYLYVHACI